ncbi:MAG: hypothetical protein WCL71_11525 [Deltaproteobacteria bacterium]
MRIFAACSAFFMLLTFAVNSAAAEEGTVATLWPLFDYRSSPATGYSNLSLLGPIFKREHTNSTTKTAFRPFFFNSSSPESEESDILYPIASTSSSAGDSDAPNKTLHFC